MVSSEALIRKIADKLREYGAKNIVVDPVMVATSGAKLIDDQAIDTLKRMPASIGDGSDSQYSGGRSVVRQKDYLGRRHGGSGKGDQ